MRRRLKSASQRIFKRNRFCFICMSNINYPPRSISKRYRFRFSCRCEHSLRGVRCIYTDRKRKRCRLRWVLQKFNLLNKKFLPGERKRRTDRGVTSTRYTVPMGGGADTPSSPGQGGTPCPPEKTWDQWKYYWMRYPLERTRDL